MKSPLPSLIKFRFIAMLIGCIAGCIFLGGVSNVFAERYTVKYRGPIMTLSPPKGQYILYSTPIDIPLDSDTLPWPKEYLNEIWRGTEITILYPFYIYFCQNDRQIKGQSYMNIAYVPPSFPSIITSKLAEITPEQFSTMTDEEVCSSGGNDFVAKKNYGPPPTCE